jgi:hypothetical protein
MNTHATATAYARATGATSVTYRVERRNADGSLTVLDTATVAIHRPTGPRYLYVKLAAVARGRAAARIAEAGLMARAARAQVTR